MSKNGAPKSEEDETKDPKDPKVEQEVQTYLAIAFRIGFTAYSGTLVPAEMLLRTTYAAGQAITWRSAWHITAPLPT